MMGFNPGYRDKQKIAIASWLIRIGLVVSFAYAGVEALRHPDAWVGFMPSFTERFVEPKLALDVISVAQLFLAAWLLVGKYTSYAAIIAVLFLGGIVIFNPAAFVVTFRDVSIMFGALALIILDTETK